MSDVNISIQKIVIDEVVSITTTDIIPDGSGNFLRSVKFLGTPLTTGGEGTLVLEVLVKTTTKGNILITAPSQTF